MERIEETLNKQGQRHGVFKEYFIFSSGFEYIVTEGFYKNNEPHGEFKHYYIYNGKSTLSHTANYKNGKLHGHSISYSFTGKTLIDCEYKNDILIEEKSYIDEKLSTHKTKVGKYYKIIHYHMFTDLISNIYFLDKNLDRQGLCYRYYMKAGKIDYITQTKYKNNTVIGDIFFVDENHNKLNTKGFGVSGCVWDVIYSDGKISIGCKTKTIAEWDEWFAGEEVYNTSRDTDNFNAIHKTYLKARKKAISFEKSLHK